MSRTRLLTAAAVAVVATALTLLLISPDAPCDSDEGHHVLMGLTYRQDLGGGDLTAFARHTVKTGRYPFLHGWFVAAAFGVLGPSYFAARATSALLLGLAAGLAALLVFRVRPGVHPLWGVLAGAFVALSPETMANGVLCMLEVPGLFLALLAAWLYHRRLERPERWGRALLVGLAVTALLFVKYPYAAYLLLPLGIAEGWRARKRLRDLFRFPAVLVWGPALLALLVWLAVPQSRRGILMLLADDPGAVHVAKERDPFAIPHVQPELVVFYARTLVWRLSPGVGFGMLGILGVLIVLVRGRMFERVVLIGSILWTIFTLALSYRTFGVDRFLVPVGGLFAVAAVAGLADLWRAAGLLRGRAGRLGRGLLLGALLVCIGEGAYRARGIPSLVEAAVETGGREAAAADWVHGSIDLPANLLMVGAWDQLSADGLKVDLLLDHPGTYYEALDVKALMAETVYPTTERLERWFDKESRWRPPGSGPRARYVLLIETREDAVPPPADPESWGRVRREALRRLEGARVVASRRDELAGYDLYRLPDR